MKQRMPRYVDHSYINDNKRTVANYFASCPFSVVLLVDEATAALDAQTAYQVADSILGLEGLTRIVVTHSLDENLLRRYDGILALKSGNIVESGSFDELMEQKGYFYSLYTVSQ